ncbi:unnamed protein product [Closterium sp. Naga37s-1]|nr:unnamed protein product [Closterium sp. Naga37s-1]
MADESAAELPPGAPPPNPNSGNAAEAVAVATTSLSASVEAERVPPGPSAVGETISAAGNQPAGQAHDSATQFSSAGEGTGGSSAALPSAGSSVSGPPPVGAAEDEELSAADVHYFAETLRQWHGRTDTPRCPAAGTFRRHTVGGKPRGGVPLLMSAPAGGSAAMRGAAATFGGLAAGAAAGEKKQKKEEEQPLLAQGGAAEAGSGGAAGAGAGAAAGEAAEGAAEFDYGKLRGVLTGLAKDVLVELWIEQHVRLVEVGEREAAAEAYRGIMERAQQLQRVSFRVPSKREGLTGIDLLLRDGLLTFLVKLSQYLPPMPEQVVKLHDVTYTAKIQRKQEGYETVGSKLLGCFLPCASPPAPWEDFNVLSDLSAYFMPGSLTLICGPPGCGKSAFHKTIAGRLPETKSLRLSGEVTYNGRPWREVQVRRMTAFVGQTDEHIPTLTVMETCKFAQECGRLITPKDYEPLQGLMEMIRTELGGMDLKLEFTLHLLGLKGAADTIVGSRTVRGVSGGERHRVTTAEMMSGMFVVMAFDEISTGLDSSATYDIVSAIRTIARVRRTTNAFSLLQPPPEVFNLFDRVIVLSEGSIIYQGPQADVLTYFEGLGYRKPPHVDVADFIQEIPTESGVEFVAPGAAHLSTAQLVEAYHHSAHYRDVMRVVQGEKVCKSVWVEVQPPIDLTFSVSGDSVVVASVAPHSHLARPDINCTDTVQPGDSVTGLALPGGIMQYAKPGGGGGGGEEGGAEGGEQEGLVSAGELQKKLLVAASGKGGGGKEGEGEGDGGGAVRLQLERPLVQVGGMRLEGSEEEPSHAKFEQEYAIPWWPSTKLVVGRQFKVAIRNTSFLIARGMQVLILGIFTGTVFFQIPNTVSTATMQLRLSIAFAATMALALGGFALIPNIIDERQVVEKQLGARFYHSTSYVIASTICNFPFSLAEVLIYGPLVYWLTGMSAADNGAHFFLFMLLLLAVDVMGATLIRLIASISSSREMASSLAGLMVITFLLFTGFLLTKPNIPPWWIWMYYINPLQYGVTAICINEFLSGSYNELCSTVNTTTASFCINKPAGTTAGEAFLQFFGMPSSFGAVWFSFAALIGFTALFISLTFLAASRIRFNENKTPPASRLPPLPPQKNVFQKAVRAVKKQMSAEGEAGKGGEEEGSGEGEAEEAQAMIERDGAGAAGAAAAGAGAGAGAGAADGSRVEDGAEEDGGSKAAPQSRVQFTPTTLSFHDLLYEVDVPGMSEPKVLLNSISGFVCPGTMTALMGSSGAGKTTLLDVLAGRKTIGRTRGDILVNSFPKVQDTFARISGYVEQSDIHTPFITIRESLQFSASLRLPATTSRAERALVVQEAMDLLELHDIADTLVGFIGINGLSVEQAKRLTIGVELVANPSVLFLDEPTSGLDSRAADIVVRGIRNIAATGRSTICTIHQPSRRLFFAFDWLYLMKRGGEVVYFGPIGHNGCDLLNYFESLPGLPKCRDDQNPATYMLEMIGAGIGHAAMRDFALDYAESLLAADNQEQLDAIRFGRGEYGPEPTVKGYAASWGTMTRVVFLRQVRTYWRNVSYSFGRIMFSIILGLILGSAFWQINYTTTPGFYSRQGLIYVALVFVAVVNANNVIPQVNAERPVYYREKASNMYSAFLYNLSWGLIEMPYLALTTLIFCSICFGMAGVSTHSAEDFFLFWLNFFLYSSCITYYGIFMAMLTPNAETATVIIPVIVNIWNITSGFMIPKTEIPSFWVWLYYLNPTQFALNSLLSIAFYCDTTTPGGPCSAPGCPTNPAACPNCTCSRITDQGDVLAWTVAEQQRSLNRGNVGWNVLALVAFIVVFRAGAYLGLRFIKYNRR